jgi:hypothetical protein
MPRFPEVYPAILESTNSKENRTYIHCPWRCVRTVEDFRDLADCDLGPIMHRH